MMMPSESTETEMAEPVRLSTKRKRRPNHKNRFRRETILNNSAEPSPDELYRILIMAAEGYVQFNQF